MMPHRQMDTKWFKARLADREISQRKLALTLQLDPAAVSLMLRGKRKLNLGEAADLARALGVPLDQVLDHAGIEPPKEGKAMVSIIGWVDADGLVTLGKVEGPRRAPRPAEVPDGAVAVRVQDYGPMNGWLVYWLESSTVDPEAVGRWAVVKVASGGTYLRVLQRGHEAGKWNLGLLRGGSGGDGATGAVRLDGVKVEWACPVIWIRP